MEESVEESTVPLKLWALANTISVLAFSRENRHHSHTN